MVDVGQVIGKAYELSMRLGEGGMGCVFKARDRNLARDVAVKFLQPGLANDPDTVQRFLNEGRALATVAHPAVVAVYCSGIDEALAEPFLVMEYVDGRPLNDRFERLRHDPSAAAGVFRQLLDGIAACHREGIIHRDLKPQNILLTGDGRVKLVDFGIAKTATCQTRTGAVMGTPQYMSPEQCNGQPSTPKSDIYSLGIIIYEMLCDRLPFQVQPDTPNPALAMALQHVNTPPDLSALDATPAGSRFKPLIRRMLEKKPELRPDAAEVHAALGRLAAEPIADPTGSARVSDAGGPEPSQAPRAPAAEPTGAAPRTGPTDRASNQAPASPVARAGRVLGEALDTSAKHLTEVTATLAETFGKKTPLEQDKPLRPAPVGKRMKSLLIDAAIIVCFYLIGVGLWWIGQRIVYGPLTVTVADKPHTAGFSLDRFEFDYGRSLYVRKQGWIETMIDLTVRYPVVLPWLYFALSWRFRQATPGQIATGVAVVGRGGPLTLGMAGRRSLFFLLTCLTLFGFFTFLWGERRVWYDRVCDTDVVE